MIADFFFGTPNDIFYNSKTTDIKFLISRKFEVTILFRKSVGVEGLYGSANDPRTANDPGPQMIPDRK